MNTSEPAWSRWLDPRNVVDKYKGLTNDQIKTDVKNNSLPMAVLMSQLSGDFNFGSIVRSANSLGVRNVFYYGKKHYDRRGAQGTYHYTDVTFLPSFSDVPALKDRYSFVALENNISRNLIPLPEFDWKSLSKPPLIIIGEEGSGTGDELLDLCEHFVEIPSFGSVRSLNAASAASIAMYDFVSKYLK